MQDALIFADVAGVVVFDQVVVELSIVVVPRLAKFASRVARLSQLWITLSHRDISAETGRILNIKKEGKGDTRIRRYFRRNNSILKRKKGRGKGTRARWRR